MPDDNNDLHAPLLDQDRTQELVRKIIVPVREHFAREPHTREKVFEALNALAISSAWVLAGIAQPDPAAAEREMARVRGWFNHAIDDNVDEIIEKRRRPGH
jgi:hypothetical protein